MYFICDHECPKCGDQCHKRGNFIVDLVKAKDKNSLKDLQLRIKDLQQRIIQSPKKKAPVIHTSGAYSDLGGASIAHIPWLTKHERLLSFAINSM
jgi:hypothetical protein